MINTLKVKGRMAELELTQKDISEYLGVPISMASLKINNIRPMRLIEAEGLAKVLRLTETEYYMFFLLKKLRNATNGNS